MKSLYEPYPSSVEPGLTLYARFEVPDEPRPLLVSMHGWHGQVKSEHPDNVNPTEPAEWFVIRPEMRGRGDSGGRPDCNGWELQDVVDAVHFARQAFADRIVSPELVRLTGGSGGGGNVMAMVGKFPDFFCGAKAECGISDYALWYRNDRKGEFRDEMDLWIGCSPDENPEAYVSRSGVALAENLCTPILLFHGERDERVPAEHSRLFVEAVRRAEKGHLISYYELKGVGHPGHYGGITPPQKEFRRKTSSSFLKMTNRVVEIPAKGRFMVGGYLKTRRFEVVLESLDRLAELEYDLARSLFRLHALTPLKATLRRCESDGRWTQTELLSDPSSYRQPSSGRPASSTGTSVS